MRKFLSRIIPALIFMGTQTQMVFAQIPQNIDVATEGETEPLSNAPAYMVLIIILLLIAFVFYIFFYRRRR